MTVRVPIRRLQQHASEVIAQAEAGARVEITRNGVLVAVLTAPDPEDAAWERLVASGSVDPADDRLGGAAPRPPPPRPPATQVAQGPPPHPRGEARKGSTL